MARRRLSERMSSSLGARRPSVSAGGRRPHGRSALRNEVPVGGGSSRRPSTSHTSHRRYSRTLAAEEEGKTTYSSSSSGGRGRRAASRVDEEDDDAYEDADELDRRILARDRQGVVGRSRDIDWRSENRYGDFNRSRGVSRGGDGGGGGGGGGGDGDGGGRGGGRGRGLSVNVREKSRLSQLRSSSSSANVLSDEEAERRAAKGLGRRTPSNLSFRALQKARAGRRMSVSERLRARRESRAGGASTAGSDSSGNHRGGGSGDDKPLPHYMQPTKGSLRNVVGAGAPGSPKMKWSSSKGHYLAGQDEIHNIKEKPMSFRRTGSMEMQAFRRNKGWENLVTNEDMSYTSQMFKQGGGDDRRRSFMKTSIYSPTSK